MLTSGDETQEKSTRLEIMRLTIIGWFLIYASGFGFFTVISTWSVYSLSRQSSTSTSMSTRVIIAQQWSFGPAWMRSSYSGSQNHPNVLLFWIDWLGVKR